MYKIAVMGDRDSVMGFKVLGLDVFPVTDPEEGRKTLHRLAREPYAIIYITEQLAARITEEISRYKDQLTPAVILIPGKDGASGNGLMSVRKAVERAVGADILFGGDE